MVLSLNWWIQKIFQLPSRSWWFHCKWLQFHFPWFYRSGNQFWLWFHSLYQEIHSRWGWRFCWFKERIPENVLEDRECRWLIEESKRINNIIVRFIEKEIWSRLLVSHSNEQTWAYLLAKVEIIHFQVIDSLFLLLRGPSENEAIPYMRIKLPSEILFLLLSINECRRQSLKVWRVVESCKILARSLSINNGRYYRLSEKLYKVNKYAIINILVLVVLTNFLWVLFSRRNFLI